MHRLLLICILGTLMSCQSDRDFSPPQQRGVIIDADQHVPGYIRRFDDDLQRQLVRHKLPGAAVVVVRDNTAILLKGYGLREMGTTDSIDIHTVFRIASLSKGFTGVLSGKMVQDGCLHWDDRIRESIPTFDLQNRSQARRITVQHILSHSSGLVRHAYTNLVEKGLSIKETIPFFRELPVHGEEGKHFAYQNAAFSMIEEVLTDKTGLPFETILHQELFDPIGMHDASCSYDAITQHDNIALPHWYSSKRKKYRSKKISEKFYNTISAGGINASIADMAEWLNLLLGNRPELISDKTLDYVFSPLVKSNRKFHNTWPGVHKCAYGLGWRVFDYQGQQLIYHGGYVNHYRSEIAINRDENIAICVLFNTATPLASKVVPQFLEHYNMHKQIASTSDMSIEGTLP